MFLVDIDDAIEQGALEMEAIPKSASDFVHSFELWFDDLRVPAENLIGVEGEGVYQVLDGLNEERLVIAAECIGLGRLALERAVDYANEREVFRPPDRFESGGPAPARGGIRAVAGGQATDVQRGRPSGLGRGHRSRRVRERGEVPRG